MQVPQTLKFEILNLLEIHLNCQSYHHHVYLHRLISFAILSGQGPRSSFEIGGGGGGGGGGGEGGHR